MAEKTKPKFVQGNQACVLGALRAGCRFFAGYPITPSSEIAELMAIELPKRGGKFIQMEDEIASMGAVIGASLTGAKVLTATSGPGFSLKQENIGYAVMAEVPCVIVNVQRGGPSTGLPTLSSQGDIQQARWGTHGDHEIIALAPSTIPEIYDATILAFNFAEKYRTPVVLLLDEIVGHMREVLREPPDDEVEIWDRPRPDCDPKDYLPYELVPSDIPPIADFGSGYRYHVTGLCHDETGFPTNDSEMIDKTMRRLTRKISRYRHEIVKYSRMDTDDAEVLLLAYGSTARAAKRALFELRNENVKVGLFKPLTIWPFPEEELAETSKDVKAVVVCESNLGQIAREVERIMPDDVMVKLVSSINGEPITPQEIEQAVKEVL